MTQRTSPTIHIDFVVRHIQLFHQRHGHDSKGFIHFPQIHNTHFPTGLGQHLLCGADRSGRKPLGLLCVRGMGHDAGQRLAAQLGGGAGLHHHQRSGSVIDRRAAGGGDGAVFFECGFERGDLVELDLARAFVDGHDHITTPALDRDRRDLGRKRTGLGGRLGTLHTGRGKRILLGAGKAVFGGAVFAKGAHGAAGFVGVFQAVQHHVVIHAVVADAVAAASFEQQVGRVGHTLHAAGHQHLMAAGDQHVIREHGCAHGRTAHLGQGDRPRAIR